MHLSLNFGKVISSGTIWEWVYPQKNLISGSLKGTKWIIGSSFGFLFITMINTFHCEMQVLGQKAQCTIVHAHCAFCISWTISTNNTKIYNQTLSPWWVLTSCATIVVLENGICAHEQVFENQWDSNGFVGSSMVNKYTKCVDLLMMLGKFSSICNVKMWSLRTFSCQQGQRTKCIGQVWNEILSWPREIF